MISRNLKAMAVVASSLAIAGCYSPVKTNVLSVKSYDQRISTPQTTLSGILIEERPYIAKPRDARMNVVANGREFTDSALLNEKLVPYDTSGDTITPTSYTLSDRGEEYFLISAHMGAKGEIVLDSEGSKPQPMRIVLSKRSLEEKMRLNDNPLTFTKVIQAAHQSIDKMVVRGENGKEDVIYSSRADTSLVPNSLPKVFFREGDVTPRIDRNRYVSNGENITETEWSVQGILYIPVKGFESAKPAKPPIDILEPYLAKPAPEVPKQETPKIQKEALHS